MAGATRFAVVAVALSVGVAAARTLTTQSGGAIGGVGVGGQRALDLTDPRWGTIEDGPGGRGEQDPGEDTSEETGDHD